MWSSVGMPVRRSASIPSRLQAEVVDERCPSDRDEHQVALDRLALAEVNDEVAPVVVDLGALLAELERDARGA